MIYPRFIIPKGPDDLESAVELHDTVIRAASLAALEAGGVLNEHHGVGMRLAPFMEAQFGEDGMRLPMGRKSGFHTISIGYTLMRPLKRSRPYWRMEIEQL